MRSILFALLLGTAITACGAVEKGAANDPRKCELDPNCANKRGRSNDCATSCSDNADCMQRCHQVTGQ